MKRWGGLGGEVCEAVGSSWDQCKGVCVMYA